MYIPDLSPYTYCGVPPDPCLLAVGWLDAEHPFPKGVTSDKLLEKVLSLCFEPVEQMRGFHDSPWDIERELGYPVERMGKRMDLGSAEIRVRGQDGVTYAAPNLIYHYMKDCHYLPPQVFLTALERTQIARRLFF